MKRLTIFPVLIQGFLFFKLRIPLKPNQKTIQRILNSEFNSEENYTEEDFLIYTIKLKEIIPVDMFDLDVTKMEDLKKIIDKLFDIYKENTTYQILKFDIAIYVPFWRASISYGFTNNYLPMFGFIGYFLFYF